MFINVQILQYFSMSPFIKYLQKEKKLKNTKVLGNMRLGLGKICSSHGESEDLTFNNLPQMVFWFGFWTYTILWFPSPIKVNDAFWKGPSFLEWAFSSFVGSGHGWNAFIK